MWRRVATHPYGGHRLIDHKGELRRTVRVMASCGAAPRKQMADQPIEARQLGRSSPIAQPHLPTARLDRAGHDAPDLGKEML